MENNKIHKYSKGHPLYGTLEDDWRLLDPHTEFVGVTLQYRTFDRTICIEDFDECDFCYEQFDKEDAYHPKKAYYCVEKHCWICETCYEDFKEHFHWKVQKLPDEEFPKDPLGRLTTGFGMIVDTDPRTILVCDCQHQVRFMNRAARERFGTHIFGRWWRFAFKRTDLDWNSVKRAFDMLRINPQPEEMPVITTTNGNRIKMTPLRNSRNEMMGYYIVCQEDGSLDNP